MYHSKLPSEVFHDQTVSRVLTVSFGTKWIPAESLLLRLSEMAFSSIRSTPGTRVSFWYIYQLLCIFDNIYLQTSAAIPNDKSKPEKVLPFCVVFPFPSLDCFPWLSYVFGEWSSPVFYFENYKIHCDVLSFFLLFCFLPTRPHSYHRHRRIEQELKAGTGTVKKMLSPETASASYLGGRFPADMK